MDVNITKSDYLNFLQCPAYFWFSKKKPEILSNTELSEFDKELILNGQVVEGWARKMFPLGVLVESRQVQAVVDTQKLLEDGSKYIFQAAFAVNGLYAMVDILEWYEPDQYWIINEVKASSSQEDKRKDFLYDASFQYVLLKQAGYNVGIVNLIELNKEYRKNGEIIARELLDVSDITTEVLALEPKIEEHIISMKQLLTTENEPMPCDCIYKSRSNHCPAFSYLYPNNPKYSVHDILRIGNSPKKLQQLIDDYHVDIADVPEDFELSATQRNHVNVEQSKISIIDKAEIEEMLSKLEYPLYFLDYETLPSAVPIYDGCRPYQQVPFQYSLHIQDEPDSELRHYEFLHTDAESHPIHALAKSLVKILGDTGSIIVWNKKFEGKCHEDIAEILPEHAELFLSYNTRLFDLMDVFSKQLYMHPDFRGSFSIKAVLPVLVPSLSYKDLDICDGSMAMNGWKAMMFDGMTEQEKTKIKEDLLKYCKLDTLAMVEILRALEKNY